jgi:hypothetical protein
MGKHGLYKLKMVKVLCIQIGLQLNLNEKSKPMKKKQGLNECKIVPQGIHFAFKWITI